TGACLMTRRDVFDRLGGFNEAHLVVNNDLDYCLRARREGLVAVYTPHARLIHYEAVSRAAMPDVYDTAAFASEWRDLFLTGDPYLNPHLARHQDDFAPDAEPNRLLITGRHALDRDEIRKILVVKLDHIGDCIIAFPAVRRLKRHFPQARVTVLTSRASKSVWALEPNVAETIEFDFFHARSALGELKLSDEDWAKLRERLAPGALRPRDRPAQAPRDARRVTPHRLALHSGFRSPQPLCLARRRARLGRRPGLCAQAPAHRRRSRQSCRRRRLRLRGRPAHDRRAAASLAAVGRAQAGCADGRTAGLRPSRRR